MNSKQVMFFSVGMVMMLAGCETLTISEQLPSERRLSVFKEGLTTELVEVSPGVFEWDKRNTITEKKNGSFEIQIGGRTVTVSPPPGGTPIFIQPLTRDILTAAQAGGWDITQMQLYISGTVVLEHEAHSTGLTKRQISNPVQETLKSTNLSGRVSTNELITKSSYENTLYILETMTPGAAIKSNFTDVQNILEVSFDSGTNGTQQVLRFVQSLSAPLGYFYLDYPNKSTIPYDGKNYEIRFDERSKIPPYLMIRTELPPSVQHSNSLPGRLIP